MADGREYLPPTQSQNPNMFFVSIPNAATSFSAVETATKCFATALALPSFSTSQSLAAPALDIVSWVVKVFEATMKSVCSAFTSRRVSARWVESTFETKKNFMLRFEYGVSAMFAMTGPRSEPPMPMLTTYLMRLPVNPFHSPRLTLSEKSPIAARTFLTPGMTSLPSTLTFALGSMLRRAV